jgi:hypothetical protein
MVGFSALAALFAVATVAARMHEDAYCHFDWYADLIDKLKGGR